MEVFFYGLFMDEEILKNNGINPSNPRKGYLDHYTLKIGNRASLIPYKNEKAYGIVMEVDHEEIIKLYAEKVLRITFLKKYMLSPHQMKTSQQPVITYRWNCFPELTNHMLNHCINWPNKKVSPMTTWRRFGK